MKSPVVALVTARAAIDLDEDMLPLEKALFGIGLSPQIICWDDADVEWSSFDAALLRSPWDYTMRFAEFHAWAKRTSNLTRLFNPVPVIEWNTDKHYLAELHAAAVAVVPSVFIEPGASADAALSAFLTGHADAEFVVKPTIGAGSRDAQRYGREENRAAIAH